MSLQPAMGAPIGVAVLGGMVFSTFVSTFFVPLAYMLFEKKK